MSKIVVIGSSNTDLVVRVKTAPSAGETILGQSFRVNPGGKGANQAVAVSRIGGDVTFVSKLGEDVFGKQMLQHFRDEGMDVTCIRTDAMQPSGVALITVEEHGENRIVVVPGANAQLGVTDIDAVMPYLIQSDWWLVQLEIPLATVMYVAELASKLNKKLVLNPAPACKLSDELLTKLWLITPNETEAEILTGVKIQDETTAAEAAAYFLRRGVRQMVITLGDKGAFVSTGQEQLLVSARQVQAVDTTAAGDVFNGALVVALSEGYTLSEAARFACASSALSVMREGAQSSIPSRAEVDAFL